MEKSVMDRKLLAQKRWHLSVGVASLTIPEHLYPESDNLRWHIKAKERYVETITQLQIE